MTAVVVVKWTERRSNALVGFCDVQMPSGLVFHDVAVHQSGIKAWASPASKPMIDRDGTAVRDASTGKIRYVPIVSFRTKELGSKFSDQVIAALVAAHPDALS